ncbi:MAG TPA: 4-(cytidine 5'-diphospho)-2-C-methyl-D-erythritol kinase [Thermodesulfovibrionales bacterium]|nr:4-(cytidine 5'-diphospho)-2-C-methyl-D-erythritol kinase [Thermodesulfovibrionales bacterium]
MLTLKAPAKINWFLDVFGKRDDGYHDIVSIMQRVTLYDSLTFEHSDQIEVLSDANIPLRENLVYRAAALMKGRTRHASGARITLKKETPMAAGLGGGSSDAACTLDGLNMLWNLNLSRQELAVIGQDLGSDVPFFFHGPAAVVEGRGEVVSPMRLDSVCTLLLVKPPIAVSTAWAYTQADTMGRKVLTKNDNFIKLFRQALEDRDFSLLSTMQKNSLETPVIGRYPVVGEIKRALTQKGAVFSSMSGSGPTVFGVFLSEEEAGKAAGHMSSHWCKVVKTMGRDE